MKKGNRSTGVIKARISILIFILGSLGAQISSASQDLATEIHFIEAMKSIYRAQLGALLPGKDQGPTQTESSMAVDVEKVVERLAKVAYQQNKLFNRYMEQRKPMSEASFRQELKATLNDKHQAVKVFYRLLDRYGKLPRKLSVMLAELQKDYNRLKSAEVLSFTFLPSVPAFLWVGFSPVIGCDGEIAYSFISHWFGDENGKHVEFYAATFDRIECTENHINENGNGGFSFWINWGQTGLPVTSLDVDTRQCQAGKNRAAVIGYTGYLERPAYPNETVSCINLLD